jgi:hypothetical protein
MTVFRADRAVRRVPIQKALPCERYRCYVCWYRATPTLSSPASCTSRPRRSTIMFPRSWRSSMCARAPRRSRRLLVSASLLAGARALTDEAEVDRASAASPVTPRRWSPHRGARRRRWKTSPRISTPTSWSTTLASGWRTISPRVWPQATCSAPRSCPMNWVPELDRHTRSTRTRVIGQWLVPLATVEPAFGGFEG